MVILKLVEQNVMRIPFEDVKLISKNVKNVYKAQIKKIFSQQEKTVEKGILKFHGITNQGKNN
ncbi:hypothetical protein Glove_301g64 [Diversispora epigaea]|uniref:Uncharacterized protein n=1 Tax=Diversispora epigaea TaxID=1348612 RepID=A0A397HZG0_9GLOM|nr:hypothetical protein Glove_301g64 [Diversispora epigaea]